MIIYSKFKDYYDHVAFEYGGGDPRVVYDRSPVNEDIKIENLKLYSRGFEVKYLFCAGVVHILMHNKQHQQFMLVNDKTFPEMFLKSNSETRKLSKLGFGLPSASALALPILTNVSKKYNLPVFTCTKTISADSHFKVEKNIPKLMDLGFAAVVNPQQMYQNIAYYVGNVIHDNPDIMPPVENSNLDKIVQHGFDIKQSFRHRK